MAQLVSRARDPRANVTRLVGLLVANHGADLAVFPELFLSGYQLTNLDGLARESASHVAEIQEVARRERIVPDGLRVRR